MVCNVTGFLRFIPETNEVNAYINCTIYYEEIAVQFTDRSADNKNDAY